MSEETLEEEIKQYKEQLSQLNAITDGSDSTQDSELNTLKNDLQQLIQLSEESLLELKKQQLLKKLNDITGESTETSSTKNIQQNKADSSGEDLVASKCRVYFPCDNTNLKMHNALVIGTDSNEENTVRVLFINPTQTNMKICEHFMNDTCKFESSCKYSHGYKVQIANLEPYMEPNFKNIKIGMSCLAKHSDELWHLATIESIDEHHICVQFKKFNLTTALEWENIFVIDSSFDDEISTSSSETSSSDTEYETDQTDSFIEANTSKKLNQSIVVLGEWERHTKGIGSKLMAKMGYVSGSGLGKLSEGRVEPVEAIVLPEGRISLDKVMELKNKKLLKKQRSKKNKNVGKNNEENKEEKQEEMSVFEFINETLISKKSQNSVSKSEPSPISKLSSKGLNIKMLELHDQIKNSEKNITKLKESLNRNKNADKATLNQIKEKLNDNEKILNRLRKAEADITNERTSQKKKNEIF